MAAECPALRQHPALSGDPWVACGVPYLCHHRRGTWSSALTAFW